jgi:hypothetical protein
MQQFTCLFAYRLNDLGMAVAYCADCPAGEHITYLIAVGVETITTLAFGDYPRQTLIIADNVLIE